MIISTDIRQNLRLLKRLDFPSLALQLILLGIGMAFIYGAGRDYGVPASYRWLAQLAWIVVGFACYFACAICDYRELGQYSWILYMVGLVLLSLVFVKGAYDDSARSVLRLLGANVQVSEPMKAAALLFCAYLLSHPLLSFSRIPPILVCGLIAIPPVAMVLLQGDGGTALVFLPFSFAILFVNGLKKRWILMIALAILVLVPLSFSHMKPYQKQRILVFLRTPCENVIDAISPLLPVKWGNAMNARLEESISSFTKSSQGNRPLDDWNARQALYSVGSGRLLGTGLMKGTQHTLNFLPRAVAPTDFIFCVIAEESGFLGALSILGAICILVVFCCRTAMMSQDAFGTGIAVGAAVLYVTHTFINIGMCVGWAPIIGIPLPFVSYGGSCLVTMLMVGGLVQSVHIHSGGIARK